MNQFTEQLKNKGAYVLVLELDSLREFSVGRLGQQVFQAGFYTYVGSALGSGGLLARLRHHVRDAAKPHWHVDYLRREARLKEIWCCVDTERREHQWACILAQQLRGQVVVSGFGASDCDCVTHLFYFKRRPSYAAFSDGAQQLKSARALYRMRDISGLLDN